MSYKKLSHQFYHFKLYRIKNVILAYVTKMSVLKSSLIFNSKLMIRRFMYAF